MTSSKQVAAKNASGSRSFLPFDAREFSEKADQLLEETVSDFRTNLLIGAYKNAGNEEKVLEWAVEAARDGLLASTLGKLTDVAVIWLLPIGFCLLGVSGSGVLNAFSGQPMSPATFITFCCGIFALGGAAGIYMKGSQIKQAFRKRAAKHRSIGSTPNVPAVDSPAKVKDLHI